MATSFLAIVNGFPRMTAASATGLDPIYDNSVSIVASGATAPGSLVGPIAAGTSITLPASFSYTLNTSGAANINIELNGQRLEQTYDWTTSGAGPSYTAFQLTFQLVVGDRLDIRSERNN